MVYVLLAEGFEEVEALTPVDMLRRSGRDVTLVGIGGKEITGARGIRVMADITEEEFVPDHMEMLILPGGYPGYENLENSVFVQRTLDEAMKRNIYVAAICGAPSILGHRGELEGKRACCYPGMEDTMKGATLCFDAVCTDGKIITSRSAATAMDFAMKLVELLCGDKQRETLMQQIVLEK